MLPIDPDLEPDDAAEPAPGHRPGPRTHRARPGVLAVILVGGFLGTLGRYELELAWPTPPGHFPSATFVINTSGAFLLGLLLTIILERWPLPRYRYLRPFAATGLLGGWTTFSTLMVEVTTLGKLDDLGTAALYLGLSLVGGLGAAALGLMLGRWIGRGGAPDQPMPVDPEVGS